MKTSTASKVKIGLVVGACVLAVAAFFAVTIYAYRQGNRAKDCREVCRLSGGDSAYYASDGRCYCFRDGQRLPGF